MTSPARKPGFRLPWRTGATDGDEPSTPADGEEPEPAATATAEAPPPAASPEAGKPREAGAGPARGGDGGEPGGDESTAAPAGDATAAAVAEPPAAAPSEGPPAELLREMVEAMRGVAEQARVSSLADVRKGVEEAVASLRASGGERAAELRRRAEEDIAGIGEWAKAEAERIRQEAESKVSGRRTELDGQLKDQDGRTERDIEGVRGRVTDYERRLSEFFDQLKEITDPASFAAAVNRMPQPPSFDTSPAADGASGAGGEGPGAADEAPSAGGEASSGAGPPAAEAGTKPDGGGEPGQGDQAETDAKAGTAVIDAAAGASPSTDGDGERAAAEEAAGEGTTMIVVKGLGSFGAITAFKQSLERTEGIGSVALALGPSGEFVYRTTHDTGFDMQAAIAELEGGAAEFQRDADGTLRVSVAPR